MRLVRGILAAIGLVGALLTQAEAQGVRIHMHVDGGYAADGELYTPSGDPPFAAVLLIPDERGLTQRVTDAAASLAEAGFEAVAVDLNRGLSADAAQHSDEQARHDLAAALAFLSLQTTVRAQDIGAFGWGSGGRYALQLASESKVRAVAIVDSAGPRDPALIGVLHAPVLASFGGLDRHVSLKFVRALRERQRALGIPFDLKVYAEASGGFDDPEDAAHFRARDALDVLHRTRDFFAAQLGK